MKQPHHAIVITMSQQTIKERSGGWRQIVKEWQESDGEKMTWWYKCGNAPKKPEDIEYVYWVVKGRIRWRCRLLQVVRDKWMMFGTREMYAKNWLVLFDFEEIPRTMQEERQGFQGFRYYDDSKMGTWQKN